ncbi:MAG: MFS transporter [Anaerolineae bacterium]|nr:MFS transporter [Anaerolineae bacterium]
MNKRSDNLLVAIAFLTFIGFGLSAGLMGVVWPSMREGFGIGDDAYGVLTLATMICSLLVTAYSGALLARFGIGASLLTSCLFGGLGFLVSILAPNWGTFVAIQGATAVGTALLNPAINTYFATHESAGRMNWLHACWGLGATISPTLMAWTLQAGGTWRAGYVMLGAINLALAVVFSLTLKRWPQAVKEKKADETPARRSSRTLALPAVWLSLLLFLTFTGMESSTGQWSFTLFTEGRGIDAATAGMWISVYYASITVGRVVFGVVVQKVRASSLMRLCMLGALLGAAAIWFAPLPAVGFAGLALAGFCLAPLFPVLTSTTPERLGAARAATVIGYQITAVRLGLSLIPALGGVLSEKMGVTSIGPFLFAVAATTFILHEATLRGKMANSKSQ